MTLSIAKDPLLTAARIVIGFFIVVLGIGIAALAVGLPAMLLNRSRILAELTRDGTVVEPQFFLAASVAMVIVAGLLALGIWFLLELRRIVNTVSEGDPFIPDNADRLRRMGWIALAAQAVAVPLAAVIIWLAGLVEDNDGIRLDDDMGFSGGGVILVLVLFILARVFKRGAEMREELEGTV